MRKLKVFMVLLLVISMTAMFAAKGNGVTLVSQSGDDTILKFFVKQYNFRTVMTPRGQAVELIVPNSGNTLKAGAPDLPVMAASVIIPDRAKMNVEVLDAKFIEFKDILIAPSKGNLTRNIDPAKVPYVFGKEYDSNSFVPYKMASLREPYIARDFRGQAVVVNPFRYNPATKTLRIYTNLIVKVWSTGERGENVLVRNKPLTELSTEFRNVYTRHFVNFAPVISRYTPLNDNFGNMLIVSYTSFMSNMASFVTWKESIGYNVDLVNYSTIGSAAALKTYVANYYNTNGLTYLLLVGDNAQVPVSSTTAGDSDSNYGFIVGSDHYLDIFVGRFSAETTAHVDTQVNRTIWYERDLSSSATWFRQTTGMGTSEGPGHNSEYDYQHINNLMTDLAGDGYTTSVNHQSGGSTANLTNLINAGKGALWYCGHGNIDGWYCGWTFLNAQVAALTNDNMLPAVFSVACQVGNFKSNTCFCEYWMRETNGSNFAGAIAHCGSTINQSWNPPMDAQDEMVDILVAGKRTFGGVFVNGMFKMNDINGSGGYDMTDTWVCFGDSSVQLRTPGSPNGPTPVTPDPPVANFSGNPTTVAAGGSVTFTDLSTNNPTSWSWTFTGGTPSSSALQNPVITYNTAGTYSVTLTATNSAGSDSETKTNYITVTAPQPPVANFTASATSISVGQNVTFTDTSTNNPTSWSWTFEGGTPSTSTAKNPVITYNTAGTYDVTLIATNAAGSDTETKLDYITVTATSYCTASSTNWTEEWISRVVLSNLNNSSGASGYTNFTALSANLTRGTAATVTVTVGYSGTIYTEYLRIYIDYNHDGDFTDTGETVFSKYAKTTISGSFTPSTSALTGATRMRVTLKYGGYASSCGTFTYGEVEDYTANIN